MAVIGSFRELEGIGGRGGRRSWSLRLSKRFPAEGKYSLTDQMRRSSRAVGAMTAEAWARRRYPASIVSKLVEALGEAMETQAWLDDALDCGYISRDEFRDRDEQWQQVGAMLSG